LDFEEIDEVVKKRTYFPSNSSEYTELKTTLKDFFTNGINFIKSNVSIFNH